MDSNSYLSGVLKQFEYYKMLGDKTFAQMKDDYLTDHPHEDVNSVATIVKHLHGNMLSRWTDFLTSDGEKDWRQRDYEFVQDIKDRESLLKLWEEGWQTLFNALEPLTDKDLNRTVFIRNMGHTVTEAINRQLAHYAYHVGQIVYAGKLYSNEKWQSLSIPRGSSEAYNQKKFAGGKRKQHFTDEFLEGER